MVLLGMVNIPPTALKKFLIVVELLSKFNHDVCIDIFMYMSAYICVYIYHDDTFYIYVYI